MLNSFPEKKVTLDLVVSRAIEASDSFQAIRSQQQTIPVSALQGLAPLDFRLTGETNRTRDWREAESPFSPNFIDASVYRLGFATQFQTGTTAQLQLSHGHTNLNFPPTFLFIQPPYYETEATLGLSQNLWQDAFGYGTRRLKQSGRLMSESAAFAFRENVEEWVTQLMGVFYNAWFAQAQVKAAQANTQRRNRLYDITQLKVRRGTSERPDALQVQSAVLSSQTQEAQASQVLKDRWQGLVISLKLPERWLTIDPKEIPIALDNPVNQALRACQSEQAPASTTTTDRLRLASEAARLRGEQARNLLAPDLELVAQLGANGIDLTSRGETFSEVTSLANPAWTLGVRLTFPLLRYAERAEAATATAESDRTAALYSQAQGDLRLNWISQCSNLKRLEQSHEWLGSALESQRRRVDLEEQRFKIGSTTTLQVIQAGDDATSAEITLLGNEVERRIAAWRILRLHDGYRSYLEKLKVQP